MLCLRPGNKKNDWIPKLTTMANDAEELDCWRDFIAGDEAAFRRLYDDYAGRLFAFGCSFCPDEETVKDAIQDLYIDLYRYRSNLDPEVNLTAYLYSSMRRKLVIILKKARQREAAEDQPFEPDFRVEWSMETRMMRNEQERELLCLLSKEIRKLSSRQREVLYLRFTLEMTYEEIAEVMAVSLPTCRTLVYRAVRQLRINMEHTRISVVNLLMLVLSR